VLVRRKNGRFLVKINEEEIPVAGISPFFAGLGSDRTQDSSTRKFVRTSLKDAEWFLSSLKRRNRTILNVTRAIVLRQRDFFMRGPKFLHPMRLQEIAGDTDLHEATVSRAAAGKYLQCEWGIFPLKYFFSGKAGAGKTRPENGGGSKESVKEILRGMLAGTEKKTSDRELAEKLAAQGIRIARRTVAKYRAELESGFRR
ncbi:MAG: RNA polymerase sigma-54 factor, partial [Spirochaetes bacterium]|nr:RNA polymerase sigma-54 factor [Candidatus Avitreponema avistercoris]